MNQRLSKKLLSLVCALAMLLSMCAVSGLAEGTAFAGGSGTADDPYQIATAEQLQAMTENLSASYVLTADIDLSDVTSWSPVGAFLPDASDAEGETPDAAYAFTGSFDGQSHVISNLNAVGTDVNGGLFGVVANATISNVTFENLNVEGNMMVAAIGYAYCSTLDNVDVNGAKVHGVIGTVMEGGAVAMVAALVGAGMDSIVQNCDVKDVEMTVDSVAEAANVGANFSNIGILGGGLEGCSMSNCTVLGSSFTADGAYGYGVGALSGCLMSAEYFRDCTVSDTTITMGDYADLTGGAVGYTGLSPEGATDVTNIVTSNVIVNAGANSTRIGGAIGGPFYFDMYADYYPNPTRFNLTNCATDGAVNAGEGSTSVGTVVGYTYQSVSENITSTMEGELIGTAAE